MRLSCGGLLLGCLVTLASAELPRCRVPYAAVKPAITAAANDAAWQQAARIESLQLHIGVDAQTQVLPTQVLLLWDEDYLYVRFICQDSEIYTPFNGPDAPLYKGDVVEVFLDPVGDSRQYLEIEVNPANSVLDSMHLLTATPVSNEIGLLDWEISRRDVWPLIDWHLDGLRSAAAPQLDNGTLVGWTADFALPAAPLLRRLALSQFKPMTMRANFIRYDYVVLPDGKSRQFTPLAWNPVQAGCPHVSPAAMGYLELVRDAE